jgi:hypothetical protein
MDLNFLKKIKIEHKIKKENFDIKADIYWKFILAFSLLLILSSFAFGYYVFTNIDQDNKLLNQNTDQKTSPIKKDKLNSVLKYFSEKEDKIENIISSPAPVIDPSL